MRERSGPCSSHGLALRSSAFPSLRARQYTKRQAAVFRFATRHAKTQRRLCVAPRNRPLDVTERDRGRVGRRRTAARATARPEATTCAWSRACCWLLRRGVRSPRPSSATSTSTAPSRAAAATRDTRPSMIHQRAFRARSHVERVHLHAPELCDALAPRELLPPGRSRALPLATHQLQPQARQIEWSRRARPRAKPVAHRDFAASQSPYCA